MNEDNIDNIAEEITTKPHHRKGVKHTDEAKAKISAAGRGRQKSPEGLERMKEKLRMPKEKEDQILEIYYLKVAGKNAYTMREIADYFSISPVTIYDVVDRRKEGRR